MAGYQLSVTRETQTENRSSVWMRIEGHGRRPIDVLVNKRRVIYIRQWIERAGTVTPRSLCAVYHPKLVAAVEAAVAAHFAKN